MTQLRATHSFSLNENEEKELQDILKKMQRKYPKFGIIDIVRTGLDTLKHKVKK